MLVATALVILMLMLFARIFGDTVRIMREQQSLSQNDQKARGVEGVLRDDLSRATMRQPLSKGVSGLVALRANWPVDDKRQRGFFSISENDIDNDADDVLHFTIHVANTQRNPEISQLYGRAAALNANSGLSPGGASGDVNQPDWDDGIYGNNVGRSHAAEVVYFLRRGNLYRRVLLLREPKTPTATGAPAQFDAQPGIGPLGAVVNPGTPPPAIYDRKFLRLGVPGDYAIALDSTTSVGTSDFWSDFDYSAWNWWRDQIGGSGGTANVMDSVTTGSDQYWLMFNGVESLNNALGATSFPIAMPQFRFGHIPPNPTTASIGKPLEYLPGAGTGYSAFIGRFTHEETSSYDVNAGTTAVSFGYPGVVPQDDEAATVGVTANPFLTTFAPNWDTNGNGVIDSFEGGPRAGEDLILSNVEAFDIEVWDDGLTPPRFVNLGHIAGGVALTGGVPTSPGRFSHYKNQNPAYGPRTLGVGTDAQPGISGYDDDGNSTSDDGSERGLPYTDDIYNRVFDTWHPNATAGNGLPPFQPLRFAKSSGVQWARNGTVNLNTVIFPGLEDRNLNGSLDGGEDANNNGLLDAGEDTNNNGILDGPEDRNGNGVIDDDLSYYYSPVHFSEDANNNGVLDMGEDTNMNGTLDGFTNSVRQPEWPREPGATVVDGGTTWQCFDNRLGLQMIRITIRFVDQASGSPRQVSIVHSFVE